MNLGESPSRIARKCAFLEAPRALRFGVLVGASALLAACSAVPRERSASESTAALSAATDAGASASPHATVAFLPGWNQVERGAIVRGGHVDVQYDASRLSQCAAPTVLSFARFLPGGETFSSDEAFSFDVPDDASSVEFWFHAVAPGCEQWDSNYGANWVFPVIDTAPADIGWAGDWGSSTNRNCTHDDGVPEPIVIDEYMRERSCIFVDVDVWVPGVTDVDTPHPEWIQAHAAWAKDGAAPVQDLLAYQGIVGHNARFRWSIPYEVRSQADWNTVSYAFEFMSDGVHTTRVAQASGADRTITRAFTFSSTSP